MAGHPRWATSGEAEGGPVSFPASHALALPRGTRAPCEPLRPHPVPARCPAARRLVTSRCWSPPSRRGRKGEVPPSAGMPPASWPRPPCPRPRQERVPRAPPRMAVAHPALPGLLLARPGKAPPRPAPPCRWKRRGSPGRDPGAPALSGSWASWKGRGEAAGLPKGLCPRPAQGAWEEGEGPRRSPL